MINWSKLNASRGELRSAWGAAGDRPYVVIDGFLEDGFCEELADFRAIASQHAAPKNRTHKHVYRKGGSNKRSSMTALQRQFFEEVNSPDFCRFIEDITGISRIYADDDLFGGGLHEILPGGYLNVHTDFNHHPETKRHRKLNLLLYLNPVWEDAWKGQIELWSPDLDAPTLSLNPIMNRVLIFETSEASFHGHPVPLACPPGITRRSLAVYYYEDFPPGLSPRKNTNYQLTRFQWAELIGRVAAESDLAAALECWAPCYQTADIERAWGMLGTETATRQRAQWLEAIAMAGERLSKGADDTAILGEFAQAGLGDVGTDALTRLRAVRGGRIAAEPIVEMPDGSRRIVGAD